MDESLLHETILTLYRGCRDVPLSDFKGWAMETARRAVAFDSGIWVTSDIVSDIYCSSFLFHQPKAMMENYYRTMSLSGDLLAQAAIKANGRTVDANEVIPLQEFLTHPLYLGHCQRYGMEYSLSTVRISPVVNIPTGIAFYRADPDAPFSETDRRTKERLVPHLTEAMRINFFPGSIPRRLMKATRWRCAMPRGGCMRRRRAFRSCCVRSGLNGRGHG